MKKRTIPALLCLVLVLLTACGVSGESTGPGTIPDVDSLPKGACSLLCRVVTNEDGNLLLAQVDGRAPDIFHFSTQDLPMAFEDPAVTEIQPGALLEIQFGGDIMETYPAQLGGVESFLVKGEGFDDQCALYLQAMGDLAGQDAGLDSGVIYLGVDLSGTSLPPAERAAVAWAFASDRDLTLVEGTWEELVDQGYINGEELYWEDGIHYSIQEKEDATETDLTFTVGKWRSGLGAYYHCDCTSTRDATGHWSDYTIGAMAIS